MDPQSKLAFQAQSIEYRVSHIITKNKNKIDARFSEYKHKQNQILSIRFVTRMQMNGTNFKQKQ